MIVYPEISFAFHRERHAGMLSQGVVHLYPQQPKQTEENSAYASRFVHEKKRKEKISYMVEETDPGRNADLLFGLEGVPGIRIEVYRYVYFGFVGHSLDLCRSWALHWPKVFGSGRIGRDEMLRLIPSGRND
jgi:hypothetical protein